MSRTSFTSGPLTRYCTGHPTGGPSSSGQGSPRMYANILLTTDGSDLARKGVAHFKSAMTQTGSPDPRIDLVCITSSCPRQFLQNFKTPSSLPGLTSLNPRSCAVQDTRKLPAQTPRCRP